MTYEQYLNGQNPHSQHIMFSVTKSFTSALILTLAEEGLIDLSETVSRYLPRWQKPLMAMPPSST